MGNYIKTIRETFKITWEAKILKKEKWWLQNPEKEPKEDSNSNLQQTNIKQYKLPLKK